MKRAIIVGATGAIGSGLYQALLEQGVEIIVFTRHPDQASSQLSGAAEYVAWQPEEIGPWADKLNGVDAVVNMAGGSIYSGRQTRAGVQTETENRIRGIRGLVQAMANAQTKPAVFLSASAVGIYGFSGFTEEQFTEDSPAATDFWGKTTLPWEEAAMVAPTVGIRTVVLRTGYALDARPKGGLAQQVAQFRRGFGGPVLPGKQWVSWIHINDVVGLILFALADERVKGPLNATSPGSVRNREFARILGEVVGKPARFPIPGFLLRLGFGVTADTIIYSRRVLPTKALALGYQFQFPTLEAAFRDLVSRID